MLEMANRNHHRERRGLTTIDPALVAYSGFLDGYRRYPLERIALRNINREQSITTTPNQLTLLAIKRPIRTKAMWATDE